MSAERAVRIGFIHEFAPFTFEENWGAAGLVVEKINTVVAQAGFSAEYVSASLSAVRKLLADGDVDLIAALANIPSRQSEYSFSKPILISGAGWFVPSRWEFKDGDVPGSIVTPRQGPLVSQIRNAFPNVEIQTSEDYEDALQTVLYGNTGADAAALNWHVGSMLIDEKYRGLFHQPKKPFNQIKLAMAGPPNDPNGLIKTLNQYIPDEWGVAGY